MIRLKDYTFSVNLLKLIPVVKGIVRVFKKVRDN